MTVIKDLIGDGKIVGLIELSSNYLYDCPNPYERFSNYYLTFRQSHVLIPAGGWSGAGRSLVRIFEKSFD